MKPIAEMTLDKLRSMLKEIWINSDGFQEIDELLEYSSDPLIALEMNYSTLIELIGGENLGQPYDKES